MWPLLVYKVSISTVERLERKVSSHLRKWQGLQRSLNSNALSLQLPIKSLKEEFKVTRAKEVLLYRELRDPKVSRAGIEMRTGRK